MTSLTKIALPLDDWYALFLEIPKCVRCLSPLPNNQTRLCRHCRTAINNQRSHADTSARQAGGRTNTPQQVVRVGQQEIGPQNGGNQKAENNPLTATNNRR